MNATNTQYATNEQTNLHNFLAGQIAAILNGHYSNFQLANKAYETRFTNRKPPFDDGDLTNCADLVTYTRDDPTHTVLLSEVKTTRYNNNRPTQSDIIRYISDQYGNHKFLSLVTELTLRRNRQNYSFGRWVFYILVYEDEASSQYLKKYNSDDYAMIMLFGKNKDEAVIKYFETLGEFELAIKQTDHLEDFFTIDETTSLEPSAYPQTRLSRFDPVESVESEQLDLFEPEDKPENDDVAVKEKRKRGVMTRFTEDEKTIIEARLNEGLTLKLIATELNMSPTTFHRIKTNDKYPDHQWFNSLHKQHIRRRSNDVTDYDVMVRPSVFRRVMNMFKSS